LPSESGLFGNSLAAARHHDTDQFAAIWASNHRQNIGPLRTLPSAVRPR